ncbi:MULTISPECIES: hypothetical protein [Klebsiella pneumoniae complex]|uniref:hypothetical protein n=1 Tax=Klebsiella pneumoniae complex TaxID=3390273 RepID=UPI001082D6BD|nr:MULTISPECIES: hypothetical protein [Klebsiella]MCE0126633.1 hypothetical protein [Klebsiella variicola subsp. variicola]VFZ44411.1 Uncharacterised protein [Klebsiella quasipneumoniae]GKK41035.1 hypothetical protein NUKP39_45250 [Klebsiella variicola]HBV7187290.1 hypothetical protein [Klebsiella pneumoniae]HBW3261573.1 hypothetical protein [Klebsiella pneumoniae]
MKYSLDSVGSIKRAAHDHELHVFLVGDDGSQHNFIIKVKGREISSLTLKDIEAMAIEHARQSFANCN